MKRFVANEDHASSILVTCSKRCGGSGGKTLTADKPAVVTFTSLCLSLFAGAVRGLQPRGRGFDSLQALYALAARWTCAGLLSRAVQVRVLPGALHVAFV